MSPSLSFVGRRIGQAIGRHLAERVGLDLDVAARRRQIEADDRAERRHAIERLRPRHGLRHRRPVGPLVLVADRSAELDAPHLIGAGRVAQRLERELHLERPPAVEAPGLHVPHRIPVGVRCAFVDDRVIRESAEGIRVEHEPAAAIVEGVEADAEVIVLPHLVGVAAQLVGNPLLRRRRVPALRGDVDVVAVEHHPDFGLLGRRLVVARRHLQHAAEARELSVDLVVQEAVELERRLQLDRADRRLEVRVARHHVWLVGRGRTVDHDRRGRRAGPGSCIRNLGRR